MSIIKDQAQKFVDACQKAGFKIVVKGAHVIAVEKYFSANDKTAFASCDMEGPQLLSMVPLRGGSVWGTDGGGVGGHVALTRGFYVLNKSGSTGVKFVAEVAKILKSGVPSQMSIVGSSLPSRSQ